MLSRTCEYALRAAAVLADGGDGPVLSRDLARITGVSPPYLKKVLRLLARSDLVHSQPGPGGGFSLSRPAEQISLLDVINAVQPLQRIGSCPLGIETHEALCPLHRKLDDALASAEAALARTSLAEIVSSLDGARPVHMIPRTGQP